MKVDYCTLDDMFEHPSFIDPFIIKIIVDRKNTKNNHWINGRVSICGVGPDGSVIRRVDIWAGFDFKYLDKINFIVFQFCQRIGVEV